MDVLHQYHECGNMEPHDMAHQSSFQALSPLHILPLHRSLQRTSIEVCIFVSVH